MDRLEAAAAALMGALEEAGITAAIAGGIAANAWVATCDITPTFDVDVAMLLPDPDALSPDALARRFTDRSGKKCLHTEDIKLRKATIQRFLCVPGEITIDLVLADPAYAAAALARTGVLQVAGRKCPLLAPEDAILYKGLARRAKDLGPIAAIARAQKLNRRYIQRWARKLGVWQFVSRAMRG